MWISHLLVLEPPRSATGNPSHKNRFSVHAVTGKPSVSPATYIFTDDTNLTHVLSCFLSSFDVISKAPPALNEDTLEGWKKTVGVTKEHIKKHTVDNLPQSSVLITLLFCICLTWCLFSISSMITVPCYPFFLRCLDGLWNVLLCKSSILGWDVAYSMHFCVCIF